MAAGSGDALSRRIRRSSGRESIDAFCSSWSQTLAEEFSIRPGFCFYDDAGAPNALAMPEALLPGRRDGTVMLGVGGGRVIYDGHEIKDQPPQLTN
jgi:hypothetical protein